MKCLFVPYDWFFTISALAFNYSTHWHDCHIIYKRSSALLFYLYWVLKLMPEPNSIPCWLIFIDEQIGQAPQTVPLLVNYVNVNVKANGWMGRPSVNQCLKNVSQSRRHFELMNITQSFKIEKQWIRKSNKQLN